VKAKAAKKAPAGKASAKQKGAKITATDQVLNNINASEKGVDCPTLVNAAGFNQRQVTNSLHRSFKAGKIQSAEKGFLYYAPRQIEIVRSILLEIGMPRATRQ
jgi:hypothetical protein